VNKTKLDNPDALVDAAYLIDGKYILAQRGKKNYFLLIAK
jgi:tyrosyl-tRNA synthetase